MAKKEDSGLTRRAVFSSVGAGGALLAGGSLVAQQDDEAAIARVISLETRLTREYGVKYPIVSAGMAFVALPSLAAEVTKAGGLGVIGVAPESPQGLTNMVQSLKSQTSGVFGVDFINATSNLGTFTTDDHIAACVAEKVPLVVFHWNPPSKHWVDTLHQGGCRVWMQTGLLAHASLAVSAGVDGIVAQGLQAGGHVKSQAPTLQILRKILALVPSSVIVLASGGIASGRHVVEALAFGAQGVWMGTRLLASLESSASGEYKRRLVEATGHSTEITTIFGPEWPDQTIRVLRNKVVKESHSPNPPTGPDVIGRTELTPFSQLGGVLYTMPKFSAIIPTADTSGDFDEMCLPAGESVNMIKEIKSASEIIKDIVEEARAVLHGPRHSIARS